MKTEYVWTRDKLRLMGVHYVGKNTCVLAIHGMAGNFIENYYANILGKVFSDAGLGFIYAHNRGYSHINDVAAKPTNKKDKGFGYKRIGVAFELFEDCLIDIDAWMQKCRALGYDRVVLLGHSLGCNKTVYYLSQRGADNVTGLILMSPPDIVGSAPGNQELLKEAQELIKKQKPRQLLSNKLWNWYQLSAQTYLRLFKQGGASDNLPITRNPNQFDQLAQIKVPILAVLGQYDDVIIKNADYHLDVIKQKATSCSSFSTNIIRGANHNYENKEEILAKTLLSWIKKLA